MVAECKQKTPVGGTNEGGRISCPAWRRKRPRGGCNGFWRV